MIISAQNQYGTTVNTASTTQRINNQENVTQASKEQTSQQKNAFEITDVYESSVNSDTNAALATYSNILSTIKSSTQTVAQSATNDSASILAATGSQVVAASSDSTSSTAILDSSSSSSEDETEETTELVYNSDGSVYEKTTTTDEDGNETVTMTLVSEATLEQDETDGLKVDDAI